MRLRFKILTALLGIAALGAMLSAVVPIARAQSVENFYQGRTVQLLAGFGPGASYDSYARVLAEHLGRHFPGQPRVVVANMEGAGSLRLASWLYNVAPRDGSGIGTTSGRHRSRH